MMYSAHKLHKQGDNTQPWDTPSLIWNPFVVPCPVLNVASWSAYRFLRRQVRWVWYSYLFKNFPQFVVIHTVKGFGAINKAEIDVFLEFSCFFDDPADVSNLISGSSAFSKSSLNIWKFMVHILLKPGLENFEHYFASAWDECNCARVEHSLALPFFGIGMKTDLFQCCGHCWVFQICWHIECSTFTASSFSIWNSSAGIPSLTPALFIVRLPKAHLTLHSRMSGSSWVNTPSWLSGSLTSFLYSSSVCSCHLFLIWAPLVAQTVKNLPAMQETWVRYQGQDAPLKNGIANHSSILTWKITWREQPGGLQSMVLRRVRHDFHSLLYFICFS